MLFDKRPCSLALHATPPFPSPRQAGTCCERDLHVCKRKVVGRPMGSGKERGGV